MYEDMSGKFVYIVAFCFALMYVAADAESNSRTSASPSMNPTSSKITSTAHQKTVGSGAADTTGAAPRANKTTKKPKTTTEKNNGTAVRVHGVGLVVLVVLPIALYP